MATPVDNVNMNKISSKNKKHKKKHAERSHHVHSEEAVDMDVFKRLGGEQVIKIYALFEKSKS